MQPNATNTETAEERSARITARAEAKWAAIDAARAAFPAKLAEMAGNVGRLMPNLPAERAASLAHVLVQANGDWNEAHNYASANFLYELMSDLCAYGAAEAAARAVASQAEAA